MSTKVVYCAQCGEIELSQSEYTAQMMCENETWHCPKCTSAAMWVGEFSPCPVCDKPVSHDEQCCQHCGILQEAIYEAIRGNPDAQNYVCQQCDE